MIYALKENAIFIPVSFFTSFSWEYDINFCPEFLFQLKTFCKRPKKKVQSENEIPFIRENGGIIHPKMFYWELEDFCKILLTISSSLYNDFSFNKFILNEDSVDLISKNGYTDTIHFDKCWIINPGSHLMESSSFEPIEIQESNVAHILYHFQIRKENANHTGIGFSNHIDYTNDSKWQFDKIWYGKPFGKNVYNCGIHNKTKQPVYTTSHLTVICENVDIDKIDDEIYDIYAIRKAFWKYFQPNHKRIREMSLSYDKNIDKIILSTNINMYEDTENIKFIYYENKNEIINEENLNHKCWPESSQRTLYKVMRQIMSSLLTNELPQKSIF